MNQNTVPITPMDAMQFGHALDRIVRNIILSYPKCVPTCLNIVNIADGYNCVALKVEDFPKLAIIFPTKKGCEPLVAFPLVLPMGWSNSPPIFCAPIKTIADLSNERLLQPLKARPH